MRIFPVYTQLTLRDRLIIERMYNQGVRVSRIAKALGRHRSTISREIKRNSYPDKTGRIVYRAKLADHFTETRRKNPTGWNFYMIDPAEKTSDVYYRRERCGPFYRNKPEPYRKGPRSDYRPSLWRDTWHDTWEGQRWRRRYNLLRQRFHSWEEFLRRMDKKYYYRRYERRLCMNTLARALKKAGKRWFYTNALYFRRYRYRYYDRRFRHELKLLKPLRELLHVPPESAPKVAAQSSQKTAISHSPKPTKRLPQDKYAQSLLIQPLFQKIPAFHLREVHELSVNPPDFIKFCRN